MAAAMAFPLRHDAVRPAAALGSTRYESFSLVRPRQLFRERFVYHCHCHCHHKYEKHVFVNRLVCAYRNVVEYLARTSSDAEFSIFAPSFVWADAVKRR